MSVFIINYTANYTLTIHSSFFSSAFVRLLYTYF